MSTTWEAGDQEGPGGKLPGDEPSMEETLARLRAEKMRLEAILQSVEPAPKRNSAANSAVLLVAVVGIIATTVPGTPYVSELKPYAPWLLVSVVLFVLGVPLVDSFFLRKQREKRREYLTLARLAHTRVQELIQRAEQYLKAQEV